MKGYKVVLEPVEDGFWMASIPAVQGCRTQAPSMAMAKRRIRSALALFVDDAAKARLEFEVRLPKDFQRILKIYEVMASNVRESEKKLKATSREIVLKAKGLKMTTRETGELLHLSHQRVDQISKGR